MKTTAYIERKSDGGYSVFTPGIPWFMVGEGGTREEAIADLKQAYKETKSNFLEDGEAIPPELVDLEFVFEPYAERPRLLKVRRAKSRPSPAPPAP